MRMATDSGGTFTDCVFLRDGRLEILKVPSEPSDPSRAIAGVLEQVRQRLGRGWTGRVDLVCGTTVGTNALLERRGGKVLLITTSGMEDTLEIGRQARPKLYDLRFRKPEPLVPPGRRIGARERLAADGGVVLRLSPREIGRLLGKVRQARPDAVAVCLLFSYRNARHEAALGRALRGQGCLASLSSEILPEFREFERTSTTVINAYLAPVMTRYLRDAARRVAEAAQARTDGAPGRTVRVMQSNGGIVSSDRAAAEPVRTVLSGPAGGVLGASYAASLAGLERIVSFDMGGTSTDVALFSGEPSITTEASVAGLPVAVPMLQIHTVGAGGGSLARFDAGGALRVGPESAGADPGPICYGRGTQPTVTDAHAVLGHFGDRGLLGGVFPLEVARARACFEQCRGRFSSAEAFAQGILGVSNSVMERALRLISIERGHDPRDYSLVAFGGAGGLHACDLAEALEMRGVLLPIFPGALSALGILRADVVRDFSRTVILPVARAGAALRAARPAARALQREGEAFLAREGFRAGARRFETRFDVRYVGQAYDLGVPARGDFVAAFHRAHEAAYGHAESRRPVEIVNVRCIATGLSPLPEIRRIPRAGKNDRPRGTPLRSFFAGRKTEARLYERERLRAGQEFSGPAVVAEYSATSLVPPGWRARVDAFGQIHLARRSGRHDA
jgi:N-methylhydantoinase A